MSRAQAGVDPALRATVLQAMAMHGGWNAAALRQVTVAASARGLGPAAVEAALASVLRGEAEPAVEEARPVGAVSAPTRAAGVGVGAAGASAVVATAAAQRRAMAELRGAGLPPGWTPPAPTPLDQPLEEQEDPARKHLLLLLGLGGGGVLLLVVVLTTVMLLVRERPVETPTDPSNGWSSLTPAAPATPDPALFPERPRVEASAPAPVVRAPAVEPGVVLAMLDGALAAAEHDPDVALRDLRGALEAMGPAWHAFPADALAAAQSRVVDLMYRLAGAGAGAAALEALGGPAQWLGGSTPAGEALTRLEPAVLSAGLLARLAREEELPAALGAGVRTALGGALGPDDAARVRTFDDGARAALTRLGARMGLGGAGEDGGPAPAAAHVRGAWEAWARGVRGATRADEAARARITLRALDRAVTQGASVGAPGADDALDVLTRAGVWGTASEARPALLRWLASPDVPSPVLFVVTRALTSDPGLGAGADVSMISALGAGEAARLELYERYARAWGVGSSGARDLVLKTWLEEAERVLAEQPGGTLTPADHLARAALLARLSRAAEHAWSGDSARAEALLIDLRRPVQDARGRLDAPPAAPVDGSILSDGWVERYVASSSQAERLAMLADARIPGSAISPRHAWLIVQEALRGTAPVRRAASEVLRSAAASPGVLLAMMDAAPTMPRTRESADLVASIAVAQMPAPHDPTFRAEVRRALAERLSQVLASGNDAGVIDRLAGVLAGAYRREEGAGAESDGGAPATTSAGPPGAQQGAVTDPTAPAPEERGGAAAAVGGDAGEALAGVVAVRQHWERRAALAPMTGREPVTPGEAMRRRAARLALARGPVQRFAVEQLAVAELMASAVSAERPARAERAGVLLAELGRDRRAAADIFEQIAACERAIVELWRLRMGEGEAS